MIYTVRTNTHIDTVKRELEAKAKNIKFGVLNVYPFKEILEEKGHPIDNDITVYELCYPVGASKILQKCPQFSLYLPCRISVYAEGEYTVLSTITFKGILTELEIDETLQAYIQTLITDFKTILHSWDVKPQVA